MSTTSQTETTSDRLTRHRGAKSTLSLPGAVAVLALLGSSGCLASIGAKDGHAVFHGCKSGDVELVEVPSEGHTKYKSVGCGHEEVFVCIAAKCRSGRILSIRHHAAAHNCKMDQITTQEPSPDEFETTGCGQTSRYRCKEVPNQVLKCDPLK
jgi:hypothetical protein